MRCDRQRNANDGHDQRPGILERRRAAYAKCFVAS
jgi:hypothetical protein